MATTSKLRPKELYIALDNLDIDFTWYPDEVDHVIQAWESGMHIADIAAAFRRTDTEVFLLLLDLANKGKIDEREGGVFGKTYFHDRRALTGAE